ncbi:MAG TPA: prolipoprotein diacylglyceryl transferase [Nitrospirae bacterium]|nr:prolipoprotein diacylglyceryl transferase [bacterium BMS3Abin10]GBE38459.1 prolipoprotein diacylglyceryl transferase [bacterium BMS3Bbin08]HDO25306.1 prolipoprotein diacylglyceryl transferase [Nitrospirota bacterium]
MYPILIKIGPLTIHTYGVFIALGFIAGIALALHLGKKEGAVSQDSILDIGFYTLLAAIAGSRLLYVIVEFRYFIKHPLDVFKIWEGGLVFLGGFLLVITVLLFYFKKHSLPAWKTFDLFTPSLALGHAIGRLGCFSAGCCYGKPSDLPWSVTFTDPDSMALLNTPLHPTQLYESFAELSIFAILMLLRRRKSFDGQILWTYVLLYSIARFIIEFFRGDINRGFIYHNFSVAQGLSVALFISAVIFIASHRKKKTSWK